MAQARRVVVGQQLLVTHAAQTNGKWANCWGGRVGAGASLLLLTGPGPALDGRLRDRLRRMGAMALSCSARFVNVDRVGRRHGRDVRPGHAGRFMSGGGRAFGGVIRPSIRYDCGPLA